MAAPDIQVLLEQIAELQRRFNNIARHATVEEIKNGFVKVKFAEDDGEGKPVLSPRLPQGDTHFGNMRAETPYKKGQSVTVFNPTGDPGQATLFPFGPNDKHRRPKHAVDEQGTEQWGQNKLAQDENTWRNWIEEEDDDGPDKGPLDEKGEKDDRDKTSRAMVETYRDPDTKEIVTLLRTGKSTDANVRMVKGKITIYVGNAKIEVTASEIVTTVGSGKFRVKDGHVKGWVDNKMFVASTVGAKIKAGGSFVAVIPGSPPIVNAPPVVGGDPVPDD